MSINKTFVKKEDLIQKLRVCNSFEDFTSLCNIYIEERNIVHKSKTIELKKFRYLYGTTDIHYTEFLIPKKSGGERQILAPNKQLKFLQKLIAEILSLFYHPGEFCHGFIKGRSIVTNAEIHTNKNFVLNVDIQDFFPSISYHVISKILKDEPFLFSDKSSKIIARIATKNGSLPQGSPLSPILSNICCAQLDLDLNSLAIKYKLKYSRYADDITFSGYRAIFDSIFFSDLNRQIRKHNRFRLNKTKTRIQTKNKRQEVTGLVVNDKINVNRTYVRNLRSLIHHYKSGKAQDNALAEIKGKLEFLKMVKGKEMVYKNLQSQLNSTNYE
ncbi:MAG: reverse transcriptase domain-containing protein [Sediminibacterium sp.]